MFVFKEKNQSERNRLSLLRATDRTNLYIKNVVLISPQSFYGCFRLSFTCYTDAGHPSVQFDAVLLRPELNTAGSG